MADINVVPKKRTNMWLWIVGVIVLLIVVMAMMGVFSRSSSNGVGERMPQSVPAGPAAPMVLA